MIEKAFLGTLLKESHLLKDTKVKPSQLEESRHKQLLKTMLEFIENGKGVDVITLSTVPDVDSLGGVTYLRELESFADVAKFDEYEKLTLENWKNREKQNILQKASTEDWEIEKVLSSLDKINDSQVDDYVPIKNALADVYNAPWIETEERKGTPTGFKQMDAMTGGFMDSELTIIGARPSMGKTDVMLHLAKQAGWHGYLPVVFSLEMPARSLTDRLIASTAGYNRMKMRHPFKQLTNAQKEKWPDALGRVSETNIQMFDSAGQTVAEMRSKTRKLIHHFDKKPVIFIDYLTLIRPMNHYNGNAHQQTTEISNGLKEIAKEFDCPVVALAQLNRSVESRENKRPNMSDLRESGSIEQIADVIMFLYRESYYDEESDDDTLEIIISKNRNGPIGTVKTRYNKGTGEIKDDESQAVV